jgi:hypothetical protein
LSPSFNKVVEVGYDRIAERYLASKDPEDPATLQALEELARDLPPGAGVPVTRWLARRRFRGRARGGPHHYRPRRRRVLAVGPRPKRRITPCPLP